MTNKEIIITLTDDGYSISFSGSVPSLKELSFAWGKLTELLVANLKKAFEGQDMTYFEKLKARTYTRFSEIWSGVGVDSPDNYIGRSS